jgi:hypothetical protein
MINPTLSDLVGGIQPVTLSDEEARRRGTQKTVLERKAPPTFDVLIEIQDKDRLAIHRDVAEAVDLMLRGFLPSTEVRERRPAARSPSPNRLRLSAPRSGQNEEKRQAPGAFRSLAPGKARPCASIPTL